MAVDRGALWIVMAICSAIGVVGMVLLRLRATAAESRLRRLGTVLSAVLDGVGIGLTAALVLLIAAAAVAWLRSLVAS